MNNRNKWTLIIIISCLTFVAGYILAANAVETKTEFPQVTAEVGTQELELDLDNNYEPADKKEASNPVEEGAIVHEDLRDETPPGVPQDAAQDINTDSAAVPGLSEPSPVGGAQNYSCPNRFVRNFSDRAPGSNVAIFTLHFTVSRPGTLDVIRGLFDRPSFGASSHLGLEPSGRCQTWVPFNKKAWTQGAFNSVAESVEIICCNVPVTRSWWLSQPIIKNEILASIVVDRLRARGIQPRRVDPVGCGVQLAGYTDHARLECGNTHTDVGRNFPWDVFGRQVIKRYQAGQGPPPLPGPRPKPQWFWTWCDWYIGGRIPPRPIDAPSTIPQWGWDACNEWARRH